MITKDNNCFDVFKTAKSGLKLLNKRWSGITTLDGLKVKSELRHVVSGESQSLVRFEDRFIDGQKFEDVSCTEFEAANVNDDKILSYEFHKASMLGMSLIEIHYKDGVFLGLSKDEAEKKGYLIGVFRYLDGSEEVRVETGIDSGMSMWLTKNVDREGMFEILDEFVSLDYLSEKDVQFLREPQIDELLNQHREGLVLEFLNNSLYSNGEFLRVGLNGCDVISSDNELLLSGLDEEGIKELAQTGYHFEETGERLYSLKFRSAALMEIQGIEVVNYIGGGRNYFVSSLTSLNTTYYFYEDNQFKKLNNMPSFNFSSYTGRGVLELDELTELLDDNYFKVIDRVNDWSGVSFVLYFAGKYVKWNLNLKPKDVQDYLRIKNNLEKLIEISSN